MRLTKKQREENAARAERGEAVLSAYRNAHCQCEDDQTVLGDVLADLMHYAHTMRADADCPVDLAAALDTARMHFDDELAGAG